MSRVLIIEDELAIAELEKDYLELSDFDRGEWRQGMRACPSRRF
jgi:DNA-binding response OmpR family regulator